MDIIVMKLNKFKYTLFICLIFLSTQLLALNPGQDAVDFTLVDHTGKKVRLSDYKGKWIVLEWYNSGCPYVRKHYDSKNMQSTQSVYKENPLVNWITIISSAQGKQGYISSIEKLKEQFSKEGMLSDHLVRDLDGVVGQAYGARTTPHMYIINDKFKISYVGAIDSIASASQSDISKAKNYVTSSLSKLLLQSKPNPQKTTPYGCSVKY